MSKKKTNSVTPASEEEQIIPAEETVDAPAPKKQPKKVKGTVVGCARLNVREQMNLKSAVLCVLPVFSEVKVIADEVHDEWYHVFTKTGIEGFCMKKYIAVKP